MPRSGTGLAEKGMLWLIDNGFWNRTFQLDLVNEESRLCQVIKVFKCSISTGILYLKIPCISFFWLT